MSVVDEHILRESQPSDSLIPALGESLKLLEEQKIFLRHVIRDINPNASDVDAEVEVEKRILTVQRRAYRIYPYPCIRHFHYVSLRMSKHDAFPYILKAAQTSKPPVLLDMGCCMGTDLRYLAHSGYPASSLIGCDLRQAYIDLGYELYADRETSVPFFSADIFEMTPCAFPFDALSDNDQIAPSLRDVRRLDELRGRVKYIYAGSLFHLFDEGTQEAIARRLATLLDVTPGSESGPTLIFGQHVGKAVEGVREDFMGRTGRFAHSPASWERLWRRIVGDTKPVRVDVVLLDRPDHFSANTSRNTQGMWWNVWIG
ncbi:hypothetical protein JVU11DRAFT_10281 [Chiua virens]|nr:hypothetical protein JVU11DRAFT_10281 [Chiua virens]